MGVLPQALKIIFEMQRKRSNEKIPRKKISFSTYKMCFLIFSSIWILPAFKPHNFLIVIGALPEVL
jgi:hypothetical protein